MTESDKERAKYYLQDYAALHLKKSKGGLYQCPICGSGSRGTRDSDGGLSVRETLWKCFACDRGGDIFTLVEAIEGGDPFQKVADLYHIKNGYPNDSQYLDHYSLERERRYWEKEEEKNLMEQVQPYQEQKTPGASLVKTYLEQTHKNLMEEKGVAQRYLISRGFTPDTIQRFQLGLDGKYLTIPYNKAGTYFTKRLIDPTGTDASPKHLKPSVEEAGSEPVFNVGALYTEGETPVFVVESALCAISILQEGGKAIAVGGTGMRKLEHALLGKDSPKILVLALDNDEPGEKASKMLKKMLEEIRQPHLVCNISGEYKDPNEHLQKNPEAFRQAVAQDLQVMQQTLVQEERKDYLATMSAKGYLEGFLNGIGERVNTAYTPTGFPALDVAIDDGLYEGLYVLGAISSLGKTTFMLQIMDNIAKSGEKDVLFFSLEMARTEIMAKSISRETMQEVLANGGDKENAKTTRGITTGKRWQTYSQEEKDLIQTALTRYESYAENLFIFQGMGDITVDHIVSSVERHIAMTGRHPVVVIDYLQIIAPTEVRGTDKQNIDKTVLELKRLSRDHKLPVVAISSFNRDSYKQAVSMASFKESGAIEYSSDVLIGLQYPGMEVKGAAPGVLQTATEKANKGEAVQVEVKILKNRNGKRGSFLMDYYPQYNLFQD